MQANKLDGNLNLRLIAGDVLYARARHVCDCFDGLRNVDILDVKSRCDKLRDAVALYEAALPVQAEIDKEEMIEQLQNEAVHNGG